MPMTHFLCPDGRQFPCVSCLMQCRMPERCMTKPTLRLMAQQRDWTGKPSTTQCINGTRLEYLKLTHATLCDPQKMAFMVLGTMSHGPEAQVYPENSARNATSERT